MAVLLPSQTAAAHIAQSPLLHVTPERSDRVIEPVSPLERTLTKNAPVSPLKFTLTKLLDLKWLC